MQLWGFIHDITGWTAIWRTAVCLPDGKQHVFSLCYVRTKDRGIVTESPGQSDLRRHSKAVSLWVYNGI